VTRVSANAAVPERARTAKAMIEVILVFMRPSIPREFKVGEF
jgi:hypothetical protein